MTISQAQFEVMVDAFHAELYRFAMGLSQQPDIAEDLVQECFARAWKSLPKLRDSASARSWFYTILRREHARLYARQRPAIRPPEELPAIAVDGYDTSPEAFVLRRALRTLTPEYREPLLLQVLGGFSCCDIGRMLGVSEHAIMTRVYRARRKLRGILMEQTLRDTKHELP